MHGTYFAQNEIFEDESAGEVRLPYASLGGQRRVYLGKSIEGVLRHRTAAELTTLFKESYVCIRRFRSADSRLLPLVLDPPRLLKNKAEPSALALAMGLTMQPPIPPPASAVTPQKRSRTALLRIAAEVTVNAVDAAILIVTGKSTASSSCAVENSITCAVSDGNLADEALTPSLGPLHEAGCIPAIDEKEEQDGSVAARTAGTDTAANASDAVEESSYRLALNRGLNLFTLYIAAGGALCMRSMVWRKLMPALHPDKGGHVNGVRLETERNILHDSLMPLPLILTSPFHHSFPSPT